MDFFDFLDRLTPEPLEAREDWLQGVIETLDHTFALNEPTADQRHAFVLNRRAVYRRGQARYRKNHPSRIRVRAANRRARTRNLPETFTHDEWVRCLSYFKHSCAVCGRPAGFWHKIVQDHWIPIAAESDNPGTVATNIIPLCHGEGGCNNRKKDSLPSAWLVSEFGAHKATTIDRRIQAYFESIA